MFRPVLAPARSLWLACACLAILPRLAAAGHALTIDFDGDGRRDHVRWDDRQPSVLHVWLSASGTTQVLRSPGTLQRVTAVDLDGDRRPELIVRDSNSRIHIWTPKGKKLHRYRVRHGLPNGLTRPTPRRIDDGQEEPEGVLTSSPFAPSALMRASPRAPTTDPSRVCAPQSTPHCNASPAVRPFAPRPPPALFFL